MAAISNLEFFGNCSHKVFVFSTSDLMQVKCGVLPPDGEAPYLQRVHRMQK